MRHRLFNFASAVSLLLCVATVVLNVRSYWVWDRVKLGIPDGSSSDCNTWVLDSNYGVLKISWENGNFDYSKGLWYWQEEAQQWVSRTALLARLGLSYDAAKNYHSSGKHCDYITVAFPQWCITVVAATSPAAFLILLVRNRRLRPAAPECKNCSYSLTGNASGVCPECGVTIQQQPSP